MKKFFVLILVIAFALAACDALVAVPTQAPVEPTSVPPTAQVIVVTVEVPVEVTVPVTAASPTTANGAYGTTAPIPNSYGSFSK
jgi:hypothetical protein